MMEYAALQSVEMARVPVVKTDRRVAAVLMGRSARLRELRMSAARSLQTNLATDEVEWRCSPPPVAGFERFLEHHSCGEGTGMAVDSARRLFLRNAQHLDQARWSKTMNNWLHAKAVWGDKIH